MESPSSFCNSTVFSGSSEDVFFFNAEIAGWNEVSYVPFFDDNGEKCEPIPAVTPLLRETKSSSWIRLTKKLIKIYHLRGFWAQLGLYLNQYKQLRKNTKIRSHGSVYRET